MKVLYVTRNEMRNNVDDVQAVTEAEKHTPGVLQHLIQNLIQFLCQILNKWWTILSLKER